MAIGKTHFRVRKNAFGACPVEPIRFDERILDLAPMRAGVHDKSAADRTGHAAQERQSIDAGDCCGLGDVLVRRRGADADAGAAHDLDRAEGTAAEPDDKPRYTAITHDEVRAETDGRK